MGIERLPNGKFETNALILKLTMIAYNILRIIGTVASAEKDASFRRYYPMWHLFRQLFTHREWNNERKSYLRILSVLTQKERIVIAVDVLRRTPSLFPKRELYDTYLRNHLRYALKISDALPDDDAVFLKEYAQNQARL